MNRSTETQADFGASAPMARAPVDESGFVRLNDEQWAIFLQAAQPMVRLRSNQHEADRIFVEAALTVMTGRRHWMQLPQERFGKWLHLHHRYSRWLDRGIWSALATQQAFGPELSRQVIEYSKRYQTRLEHQRRRRRSRLLASDD